MFQNKKKNFDRLVAFGLLYWFFANKKRIMSELIEVVPHEHNWANIFEKEAAIIKEALGNNCLEIHGAILQYFDK